MTQNTRNSNFLVCFILVLIGISSCSIKKKKDSSFTANFSTKFNILYNSKLLLQQAQKNTEESIVDNFQQVIPIFKEPNLNSIQQNKALMDSVLGKTTRIINEKHDSKYVDLAFLLKGKAFYFQGDYYNANEFFDYVKKNGEDNPAIQQEALIWQIRSLIQLDNLTEATKHLEEADSLSEEIKGLKALLFATQAKFHLYQNNKDAVISQLSKAVEFSKDKKNRLRWHYILGQLLFEKGENELAYSHFSKVAKSNESYEMIFYTNLYRIEILNKNHPNIENKIRLLSKLLRDGKNKNYKGQIYQHIGDIYLADQQLEKAIQYYEQASHNTVNNPFQQALNYQRLADIYFNEGEYTKSSLYYDSTLLVLPKDNPNYDQLSRKQVHLESLVAQLTTISYQDSLIMLATLSPEDRENVIEQMIAKNKEAKLVEETKKQPTRQSAFSENSLGFTAQREDRGVFYFNSAAAVSQGYSDFKKRWGNRAAGTNWRYSNQPAFASSTEPEVALLQAETEDLENISLNPHERYLRDLPDSPEKIHVAENTIKNAYLALGEIYQYNLQDESEAIKTYEKYLDRFANDENTALLYYHLYRLYADQSPEKLLFYKEKLLSEYPDSKYSLVINDPEYYKNQQDLLEKFNDRYSQAYDLFSSRKYNELIQLANETFQNKDFSSLENNMAQLGYLRALSIGRTAGILDFKASLDDLATDYPEEEVVIPLVKRHLVYIDSNQSQFLNKAFALEDLDRRYFEKEFALTPWPELSYSKEYDIPVVRRNYDFELSKTVLTTQQSTQEKTTLSNKSIDIGEVTIIGHENSYRDLKLFPDSANYLFVINIMHGTVNLSPSRYGIGQFNRSQYPTKNITHQLKTISDENQLVYIGVFSTFAEAKAYEEKITPLLNSIMKIPEDIYTSFIITDKVFNTFANFDHIEDYYTLYQTQR